MLNEVLGEEMGPVYKPVDVMLCTQRYNSALNTLRFGLEKNELFSKFGEIATVFCVQF